MIGKRKDELGGSLYYSLHKELGANVPNPNIDEVKDQIYAITDSIDRDLINACHDISDGGVAVTLSEMTFENSIGCNVNIPGKLSFEKLLFSETGGFIIEVISSNVGAIKKIFQSYDLKIDLIGETTKEKYIKINDKIDLNTEEAKKLWLGGLRNKIK